MKSPIRSLLVRCKAILAKSKAKGLTLLLLTLILGWLSVISPATLTLIKEIISLMQV